MRVTSPRILAGQRVGSALLMALMAVLLIGGMTVALLQIGLRFSTEQSSRREDERALMLAEAGLDESLVALRLGRSGTVGDAATPALLGDGVLWSAAAPVSQALVLVRAAGMCGSGRAALEQLVFHYPPGDLISFAIFANNDLRLESNVLIDSFDPALGTYADQLAAGGLGHVDELAVTGSNGALQVESSVEVWGDLHPGPGHSVSVPNSSSVSGSLQALPESIVLQPVAVPAIPVGGDLIVAAPGQVLAPGDWGFDDFEIKTGASLTVQGPARLVIDDLDLESNSLLTLDSSTGAIEIYVQDDAVLRSNSGLVTTEPTARGCSIFFVGDASQTAVLRSNSDFYGRIYSQQGRVVVSANFEIFGNVVADRLVLASNSRVHYDVSLSATVTPDDERFVPYSWSIAAFPVPALLRDRGDPFQLLGVAPGGLPSPAAAHAP